MDQQERPRVRTHLLRGSSTLALATVFAVSQPLNAFASLSNTVTVNGTSATGSPVTSTDNVNLPVTTADPKLKMVKSWAFKTPGGDVDGDGKADAGDTVVYTYIVTNTGTVTIDNVSVTDTHDGTGTLTLAHAAAASSTASTDTTQAGDNSVWGTLVPNDSITFTAEYVVTAADITGAGGGTTPDGDLDNTATPNGTYIGNPTTPSNTAAATDSTSTTTAQVPLDVTSTLTVDKKAYDSTGAEITGPVTAGMVVTYKYVVTNTGNTPITNVSLSESFNGTGGSITPLLVAGSLVDSGTAGDSSDTGTDQTYDKLGPGDQITYAVNYTVTQSDIDQLQ